MSKKYTLKDLLKFTIDQKPLDFQEAFISVLKDRLYEAVEQKKFMMRLDEVTEKDLQAIANLNHMRSYTDVINPGQLLQLPNGSMYGVKKGDNLWHIAQGKGKGEYYKPVPAGPSTVNPDTEKPIRTAPEITRVGRDANAGAAPISPNLDPMGKPYPYGATDNQKNIIDTLRKAGVTHDMDLNLIGKTAIEQPKPEPLDPEREAFFADPKGYIEKKHQEFNQNWDQDERAKQQASAPPEAGPGSARPAPQEPSWMDQYVRIPLAKAGMISKYAAGLEDK